MKSINKAIEHDIQKHCVNYYHAAYGNRDPKGLGLLFFPVPNGQKRSRWERKEKKEEGLTAGVADMLLLVPNRQYHGLCIEFKHDKTATADKTYQSKEQKAWEQAVTAQGYAYAVVRSFDQFRQLIDEYLNERP